VPRGVPRGSDCRRLLTAQLCSKTTGAKAKQKAKAKTRSKSKKQREHQQKTTEEKREQLREKNEYSIMYLI
jgi:hypothetical protein